MPRTLAWAIVAAALMLRVLIPQGWMPAPRTGGGWAITLCSGTGAMTMPMGSAVDPMAMAADAHAMPMASAMRHASPGAPMPHGQDHAPGDHPCLYAALALALAAPVLPLLALPGRLAVSAPNGAAGAVALGRGLAAPPPPSTGPPAP